MKRAVFDFSGQGVVVTGGATSVGRVMAEEFLAAGAKVHTCDIDADTLQKTLQEVPGLTGSVTNVGDPEAVEALAQDTVESLGQVDILVNNVGIDGQTGKIEDLDVDKWRMATEVNLNSMFYTCRQFVPSMKKNNHGAIINISSVSVQNTPLYMQNYNSTKTGVEGLTATLARELGPHGIRCNAIRPGGIDNERVREHFSRAAEKLGITLEEAQEEALKFVSMRTLVQPEEISDAVLFLASPSARHITGQMLGVCGGFQWD